MYHEESIVLYCIVALVFLSSCEKTEHFADDLPNDSTSKLKEINQALYSLAEYLVEDKNSGGDIIDRQIELYNESGVEEFLLMDLRKKEEIELRTPTVVQQLLNQNPLMEIAYPSFALYFETVETFSQHINNIEYYVVIDSQTDPESSSITSLPAYDENGNALQISSTFDQYTRYAVITMDEAHDAVVGSSNQTVKGLARPPVLSMLSPARVEGNVSFYQEATIDNAIQAGKSPFIGYADLVNLSPPPPCDRPANKKDQLYKIRFSDKQAVKVIEGWWDLPKVELVITYGIAAVASNGTISNGQFTTQVEKKWRDMTDSSWDHVDEINQQIITWLSTHADTWGVLFIERDRNGGNSSSFTFGVSPKYTIDKKWEFATPVSFTVPMRSRDEVAGNVIIECCDPAEGEGTAYKVYTGGSDGMYFRENLQ